MPRKKTTEEFIQDARKVHGDRYDYSKVEYTKNSEMIIIICPDHGEFFVTPIKHIGKRRQSCPVCLGHIRNTNDFILKAKKIHGDKYDYSQSIYVNALTKIDIICPKHGVFTQTAPSHCRGDGCSKCSRLYNYTTEEWIGLAKTIHDDVYDYANVKYINNHTHIKIICKKHGEFEQLPIVHTTQKCGCPECGNERGGPPRVTVEEFKQRSKEIHKNKFDYSLIKQFKNTNSKVKIICPKCGLFEQSVNQHLSGNGCKLCRNKTQEEFINEANNIHGNTYSYDKVNFIDVRTPVIITCKIHGDFSQKPKHHVGEKCGCPTCKSSKGEQAIYKWLNENNIQNIRQYRFDDCVDKIQLPFDFYLPDYNVCIEYDGEQHFTPSYFGKVKNKSKSLHEKLAQKNYKNIRKRDKIKNEYCTLYNICLIRIPYTEFDNIEKILFTEFN